MIFTLIRDILSNFLLGLTALVVLVLAQINPVAKNNPDSAKPPGQIAVTIVWKAGPYDIDLWTSGPGQDKATGYSNRSGKVFSLLRDDLGTNDGAVPFNMENAYAREVPPGEYVVNIHAYSIPEPMMVHIEVALGSGDSMRLLVKTDMEIKPKQERTVIRFTLDAHGDLVPESESQVFKGLRSTGK